MGAISPSRYPWVQRLIDHCPPGGRLLDAACGTGKYFPMVAAADRRLVGTDQSAGMLTQAHAKHPDVPLERVGLQELAVSGEFDAVMCVDAMENIPPEVWPDVVANLRRALRSGGHLYLTVELADPEELQAAEAAAVAAGVPVVAGEHYQVGGGYHYYPPLPQVRAWLEEAGLTVIGEETADGYRHLLARANDDPNCPPPRIGG